jgi:cation transport regulator ChaC
MLCERLKKRVPEAELVGRARVARCSLRFHKRSTDESGKCNLFKTGLESDEAYGVLFEIPESQIALLDEVEGLGKGYERAEIQVIRPDNEIVDAFAYIATADAIDPALAPYDWYRDLVISGARQNELPEPYVQLIEAVGALTDPKPKRKTRLEALEALAAAVRRL